MSTIRYYISPIEYDASNLAERAQLEKYGEICDRIINECHGLSLAVMFAAHRISTHLGELQEIYPFNRDMSEAVEALSARVSDFTETLAGWQEQNDATETEITEKYLCRLPDELFEIYADEYDVAGNGL